MVLLLIRWARAVTKIKAVVKFLSSLNRKQLCQVSVRSTWLYCFFTGPLNNLKESMIQFSKPRKLVNRTNPVQWIACLEEHSSFFFEYSRVIIGSISSRFGNAFNERQDHWPASCAGDVAPVVIVFCNQPIIFCTWPVGDFLIGGKYNWLDRWTCAPAVVCVEERGRTKSRLAQSSLWLSLKSYFCSVLRSLF